MSGLQEKKRQVLYLSHGAGPLPLLGDAGHKEMVDNLESLAAKIEKPSAILLISAHWEEQVATLTSGQAPSLIYDYYDFPPQSYTIKYPAPGDPDLALAVRDKLIEKGISSRLDDSRGFDHGMFVPLKIMYPEADIPCVELSLVQGLDAELHLDIGAALAELSYDNLLIIGSGFSFHNMRAFSIKDTEESRSWNENFESWLIDTCSDTSFSAEERWERLRNWTIAPHARYCHPREEHLIPLHVCAGAAGGPCSEFYELEILGKKASVYLWQE
ncbi:DODA-type extradiol aromatic ring-opening family dioxygenase [Maridesulfovibrio bastinii]|uniref:DODA-type extradiol aromatic ring-opening family dioxygenase n=1 Tax=Maridesulfovibrio bastinii TaxID=47157 RepID=UPI0003F6BE64|nr:class III extradiol ring-cleavage dioxygenase [Maridesulfovibrio bastinii]